MRLMAETGLRAGEVLAIQMADVDLHEGRVIVRRGKGGKGAAPFGAQTAAAMTATCAPDAATDSATQRPCGLAATAKPSRTTGSIWH